MPLTPQQVEDELGDAAKAVEGILELLERNLMDIGVLKDAFVAQQQEIGALKHRVALLEQELKDAQAAIGRMRDDKRTQEFARSRGIR